MARKKREVSPIAEPAAATAGADPSEDAEGTRTILTGVPIVESAQPATAEVQERRRREWEEERAERARIAAMSLDAVLATIERLIRETPLHDSGREFKHGSDGRRRRELVDPMLDRLDLLVDVHFDALLATWHEHVSEPEYARPLDVYHGTRHPYLEKTTSFEWLRWCELQCSGCRGRVLRDLATVRQAMGREAGGDHSRQRRRAKTAPRAPNVLQPGEITAQELMRETGATEREIRKLLEANPNLEVRRQTVTRGRPERVLRAEDARAALREPRERHQIRAD
jgi:hypothetical protein